jgi:hypothetical protein
MKVKRFNKQLVLNKKTIADLDIRELKAVNGGVLITFTCTCAITGDPVCVTTCPLP